MEKENHSQCNKCNNEEEFSWEQIIKISISLILFIVAILIGNKNKTIFYLLFFLSYTTVGLEIIIKAFKNLLKGKVIEENFLMTIATIGAICIGEFPEAVAVMLFYQIGEFASDCAVDKSKKHIKELMNIRPDFATVKRKNIWEKINPEEVKLKEIVLVKPGEKVPLDGIIKKGESFIDTSALTGESIPKYVNVEDKVLSGSINQSTALEIEVTTEFKESTVSKILNLVENASNKKAEQEKFITAFAKIYTPIVVILAIIIAILPPLITTTSYKIWAYRALSFLVISCPCALVISIPLSFFAGIGVSAKHGILIKGSNYLENLSKVNQIVFDKTGTLTKGVFSVQKVITNNIDKDELLKLVSQAEYYSNHPIATSIKEYYKKEINTKEIKETKELSGLGIKAKINENEILVGNEKLMNQNHISYNKYETIGTILYIAINNKYKGTIVISDKIKEDTTKWIEILQNKYHIKTIMLTGDKEEIAKKVKEELMLNDYYAELLPNEKVKKLEEFMKKKQDNERIAFVGDGINDAPALAISDLGIAMGSLGSDAAIEASDIVIMKDEISKIVTAINISNKTLKIVKENIIFAMIVKIIILLLSVLGITTMWIAVFADVGVSILAILNSLRLLKYKKEGEKNV